ncbi:amino acid ABC transporter permease [Enterococcus canis]|uniref:Amino acid ABC transporter permease n=1 Tax=Enterococcus canis TaxID=214095 RepID=A0A1L8RC33_9ENTE|nr:ABC transporter permease subunit [Enterococcus canis]OJG17331.1 amino acid ABC transporter permease [Enterococcus canis]
MKKLSVQLGLLVTFLLTICALPVTGQAVESTPDGEFRVGMEAGYAPFNWTQTDDSHGAVPIQGSPEFAGGYDVQMAKRIAEQLGKQLVIVKTEWDGLQPALTSGKIDAIIAGMSPTEERRKQVDFTDPYYESNLVVVVQSDGPYAKATSLADLKGAKITAQLNTFHYTVIDQIPGVNEQPAMDNFPAMRVALESGTIDGYVTERPEGVTAETVNKKFKMLEFAADKGFKTNPEDTTVAIGLRKGDPNLEPINQILSGISQDERNSIMDAAIKEQPAMADEGADDTTASKQENWFVKIISENGMMFLRGAGMTLFLAIIGTFVGTVIGLLVGIFRSFETPLGKVKGGAYKAANWLINAYIDIFRGTPMIVQAAVIYYGLAQLFSIDLDRTAAALFIVSINTGAYMTEIVRGGFLAVDKGQFEAAQAIGMTHWQTMRKVVLPQVLRNILPATGNELVINIKDTSVLSIISVSELFFQGKSVAGANYMFFQTYFIICIIYFIMTYTATRILRYVEKKMDGPDDYMLYANQMQTSELKAPESH